MKLNQKHLRLLLMCKMKDAVKTKEVPEMLLCSYKSGAKYLRELVGEGLFVRRGHGSYTLSEKGLQEIKRRGIEGKVSFFGLRERGAEYG